MSKTKIYNATLTVRLSKAEQIKQGKICKVDQMESNHKENILLWISETCIDHNLGKGTFSKGWHTFVNGDVTLIVDFEIK